MMVAILGAGPVGLVSAHTVELYGHTVSVHGIKVPSEIKGAQYIHHAINELTPLDPEGTVTYRKVGTQEGYAQKVYGHPDAPCSWDRFDGELPAWNINAHYSDLWQRFEDRIVDTEIRAPYIESLLDEYDLVISSINPLGYCQYPQEHEFHWTGVRIVEYHQEIDDNTIIYSGDPDDDFYRVSSIFGHRQAEYPQRVPGRRAIGAIIRKPLHTTCDCFLDDASMVRVGRFGEFKRGLLVTDAFDKVAEELDADEM